MAEQKSASSNSGVRIPQRELATPSAETDNSDSDWDTDMCPRNWKKWTMMTYAATVTLIRRASDSNGYPVRSFSVYGVDDGMFNTVIVVL